MFHIMEILTTRMLSSSRKFVHVIMYSLEPSQARKPTMHFWKRNKRGKTRTLVRINVETFFRTLFVINIDFLEVTIIPTYDTDVLGYWVSENEELLAKYHIDLSPSAARCTINLQDHETSCSAYRLEF